MAAADDDNPAAMSERLSSHAGNTASQKTHQTAAGTQADQPGSLPVSRPTNGNRKEPLVKRRPRRPSGLGHARRRASRRQSNRCLPAADEPALHHQRATAHHLTPEGLRVTVRPIPALRGRRNPQGDRRLRWPGNSLGQELRRKKTNVTVALRPGSFPEGFAVRGAGRRENRIGTGNEVERG